MIAKRPIKAGEEVSDFYGAHYFQSSRHDRHQMLGFPCQCRACADNWPLMRNLAQFTRSQLSVRSQWSRVREKLDQAVANMSTMEVFNCCKQLASLNGNDE